MKSSLAVSVSRGSCSFYESQSAPGLVDLGAAGEAPPVSQSMPADAGAAGGLGELAPPKSLIQSAPPAGLGDEAPDGAGLLANRLDMKSLPPPGGAAGAAGTAGVGGAESSLLLSSLLLSAAGFGGAGFASSNLTSTFGASSFSAAFSDSSAFFAAGLAFGFGLGFGFGAGLDLKVALDGAVADLEGDW